MTTYTEQALERIFDHEGGYSDDPKDRGNWTYGEVGKGALKGTKYGISAAAYPDLNIKELTLAQASLIYERDYFAPFAELGIPFVLFYQLCDYAVNSGTTAAIKALQRCLGVKPDGIIGPITKSELSHSELRSIAAKLIAYRIGQTTEFPTWDAHGKGWTRRNARNLRYFAADTRF